MNLVSLIYLIILMRKMYKNTVEGANITHKKSEFARVIDLPKENMVSLLHNAEHDSV